MASRKIIKFLNTGYITNMLKNGTKMCSSSSRSGDYRHEIGGGGRDAQWCDALLAHFFKKGCYKEAASLIKQGMFFPVSKHGYNEVLLENGIESADESVSLSESFKHLLAMNVQSAVPYLKLIDRCCHFNEVTLALDITDVMLTHKLKLGNLRLGLKTIDMILSACDKRCEYHLVNRVCSIISGHAVRPNIQTFQMIVHIYMKMNKFQEAYGIIEKLKEYSLYASAEMYNAIINGYLRQNQFEKAISVFEEMERAKVKPNAYTFRLIIAYCPSEELIMKHLQKCKEYGVLTKQVFFGLVSAYTSIGLLQKAKEVLQDKMIPYEDVHQIKSKLVFEFAIKGHISDALALFEDMKRANEKLDEKTVLALIQHGQDSCELQDLLQLLNELGDHNLWLRGCDTLISYCVRHKELSFTVDLLNQRLRKTTHEMQMSQMYTTKQMKMHSKSILYEAFVKVAENEPADVQFGLDLLRAVREVLHFKPPRVCLEVLLSAFVKSKEGVVPILKEFELCGYEFNPANFLGMHQAHLASGHSQEADLLLHQIPKYYKRVDDMIKDLTQDAKSVYGDGNKQR